MQGRRILTRVALVAGVGAVALLGEVRSSSSLAAPVPRERVDGCHGGDAVVAADAVATCRKVEAGEDSAGLAEDADEAGPVPAIYSWNPDVRFVYYRHVSKWM